MPAKEIAFSFFLDPENTVRLRTHFTTERDKVLGFGVQLGIAIGGKLQPLARIDNAHGYVHQHAFYPDGRVEERRLKFNTNNEAYTYAYQMLKSRWRDIRDQYER